MLGAQKEKMHGFEKQVEDLSGQVQRLMREKARPGEPQQPAGARGAHQGRAAAGRAGGWSTA